MNVNETMSPNDENEQVPQTEPRPDEASEPVVEVSAGAGDAPGFNYDRDQEPGPMRLIAVVVGLIVVIGAIWWAVSNRKGETAPPVAGQTAGTSEKKEDAVIATVDGIPIRMSEFEAAVQTIPEQMRAPLATPAGRARMIEELVRLKLLEREAKALDVEKEPAIAAQLSIARGNILANAALERLVKQQGSQTLEQLYERNKKEFETLKARQIVIAYQGGLVPARAGQAPGEEQARARAAGLVERLRGGADFESLAKKESDEPGVAQTGGSIGEVSHDSLPPEIDSALFALPVNQISDPVKSRYAYHIFQVTEKEAKTFEEVKPFLEQRGESLRAREIIEGLAGKAKIEYKHPDFTPPSTN
ncbi:MAG TPA: peptidylprolyl isomerase [Thermoanaerobaculia bacterium]|nr:peptidylprolyl isomerase [Thermoanaerobaculia bacterium]